MVSSSGTTPRVRSRQACSTSGPRSMGYHKMPAYSCVTGNSRSSRAVTMPKLPPPPRSAQNRSGSSSRSARRSWPSAVTTSIASTLLADRPYLRPRKLTPPPRVYPATPTFPDDPASAASPCLAAACTTSDHTVPASTRAVRASGSISTRFIRWVLSKMVLVSGPSGMALCPVPWAAIRRPWSAANVIAAATSRADPANTTAAGSCSAARLKACRASSKPGCPGSTTSPVSLADSRLASCESDIVDISGSFPLQLSAAGTACPTGTRMAVSPTGFRVVTCE